MTTAIAYLTVNDGQAALDFYRKAFGAQVTERYDDGDKLGHATLAIGDAEVYVSDEYPDLGAVAPTSVGGATAAVVLSVANPDAQYSAAVDAGAHPQRPVKDDPAGRNGWLVDPFGHRWNIRQES